MFAEALGWLGRNSKAMLVAGIFLGLAVPPLASLLRPLLTPAVVALLALTLLRMDWTLVRRSLRRPLPVLLLILWLLVVSPAVMALATNMARVPAGLAAAMLLWAASPPLIAAPALATLLGLDAALALVATVLATFAMPLVLPPLALHLAGIEVGIAAGPLFLRLAILTFGALLLALAARRLIGAERLAAAPERIDGGIVLALLVFAVAAMDGITARAIAEPARVGVFVFAAFCANLSFQALGALLCARLPRRTALALGIASGNRNIAILVGSLGSAVPPDLFLYFAVGQLPIYLLPGMLAPIYRRLARASSAERPE
jgi:predicted Na+-dependent transporter